MTKPPRSGVYIGLGANLPGPAGPPQATLAAALARLAAAGVVPVRRSRWYRSPAWPDPADPAFVNAVAEVETALEPAALLALLHRIEIGLGRKRSRPNAPRPIDLDLLDYRGAVAGDGPVLPHPRLHRRAFVLLPLAEIAPGWRHPVSRRSVAELIAALPAQSIAGPIAGPGA
jgi:2-amino-4-hydroxy-6-hydroxymethyldihydropteridine diphosphokinase